MPAGYRAIQKHRETLRLAQSSNRLDLAWDCHFKSAENYIKR